MKKLFAILLMLVMLVMLMSCTAFAEFTKIDGEFSIRGGVMFGMSPEEVKAIESGTANEEERDGEFRLGYKGLDSLAGIPIYRNNSDVITYKFPLNEKKLDAIEYWFGYYDGGADKYFDDLCSAITGKYGEPLHFNDGNTFSRMTPTLEKWLSYVGMGLYSLRQMGEWGLDYGDYYVLIDVFTLRDDSATDQLIVGYKYFSAEEMSKLIADAITDEQEKESQRNNDI